MKPAAAPLLLVPFREVRHDEPDDCLHYEPVAVRGQEMDWTIPAHRHEGLHQIQFLESGHISGTVDGRAVDAQGPAILLIAPGSVHGFRHTRDTMGHQLTIPSATLQQLLSGTRLADTGLAGSFVLTGLTDEAREECASLFERLAREFLGHSAGRVPALLAIATLLAVLLLRLHGEHVHKTHLPGARDALVQRYLALAEKHFREHRGLPFYADTLGVTPDHLSRTCRNVTRQSALQLLHERLMLEARRLLAYTPMSVLEVAAAIGYQDPAYFSKFFTRAMGCSPSQYRTQAAQGVKAPR
ncbi:transcriptional regulator, AraC family [Variovorax sp. HW608]|uniref:helix-turn-helix domain-containing protein n=1 Tax=Variovorax sp. HW608 TaxID=1034889 RepID=UPI00082017A7|nr:helix-turn-helix domain-containing protein [Variovorax sp. HW608]SCK25230.1 transcriptional regulator, AraC family [Variovorax sp. HW608]